MHFSIKTSRRPAQTNPHHFLGDADWWSFFRVQGNFCTPILNSTRVCWAAGMGYNKQKNRLSTNTLLAAMNPNQSAGGDSSLIPPGGSKNQSTEPLSGTAQSNLFFFKGSAQQSESSDALPRMEDADNLKKLNSIKGLGKNDANQQNSKFGYFGARNNSKISPQTLGSTFGKLPDKMSAARNKNNKDKVVSITYEEIGLFPRSFSRVIDRFLKQIFSDVENLVIQEYRFYRYLFLTTIQTIFILLFVPLFVNFIAKTYLIRPVTEFFWNTKQTEIFLNSYEQKRAFLELQDFEEKLYFESLLTSKQCSGYRWSNSNSCTQLNIVGSALQPAFTSIEDSQPRNELLEPIMNNSCSTNVVCAAKPRMKNIQTSASVELDNKLETNSILLNSVSSGEVAMGYQPINTQELIGSNKEEETSNSLTRSFLGSLLRENKKISFIDGYTPAPTGVESMLAGRNNTVVVTNASNNIGNVDPATFSVGGDGTNQKDFSGNNAGLYNNTQNSQDQKVSMSMSNTLLKQEQFEMLPNTPNRRLGVTESAYADAGISQSILLQERLQEKTVELAIRYNNHSIESITNFFADFLSLLTLLYLLVSLEIQINITKSFLLEVFFGLDDSKKSLLILIMTDLLVGYHSSNLWELFFQFIFNHYGIPESQTGIFLLVATLPVLLDVLFKYLIFRHLNRASPATVATYHAILE